jgi:hypothetical protein
LFFVNLKRSQNHKLTVLSRRCKGGLQNLVFEIVKSIATFFRLLQRSWAQAKTAQLRVTALFCVVNYFCKIPI